MKMIKHILLAFILVFLFMFYFQKKFNFINIRPLDGIKELAAKPKFTLQNFFNLQYQDSFNLYVKENIGFHSWLVRSFNQLNFSFFHTTKAPGVVVGKNGNLFIESYINNYTGINFIGKTKAENNIRKIKIVQDSLKKYDIDLLIVFAIGKASYYPYNIPESYMLRKKDTTNYNYYSERFKKEGINFIDFNRYFIERRSSFVYPVYPEYGTHWTPYAYSLAMDSIIHYIEKMRNIDMPDFDYSKIYLSDSLREREYDIGILLNLYNKLPHKPMPYPVYKYYNKKNQKKPDVLAVGDSYWWCMTGDDIPSHVFKEDVYWFYNKDIYKKNIKMEDGTQNISFADETVKRDVILLMATEATFDLFPYGFIDKAYELYGMSTNEKKKLISDMINGNAEWKKSITQKAKENNISEKEQFNRDMEFMLKQDYTPVKPISWSYKAIVAEYVEKIKRDPNWFEEIKKKAVQNGNSLEFQLEEDALFVFTNEYGSQDIKRQFEETRGRILSTPEWVEQIKVKAKNKNIPFEDALELDVKYIYDTELKPKN
ncbi:MAG TPA: hypothetical protein VNZ49_05680 [Bacteroidia bacterium]|jgi:alginate O-acetyltransferase complex protein AlgJ|nr:hypothetical protein [Bacteroidia bacterium]